MYIALSGLHPRLKRKSLDKWEKKPGRILQSQSSLLEFWNPTYRRQFFCKRDYVNPAANELLPSSHNTIRAKFLHLFQEGKTRVQYLLQLAISDVHITCDLWTSPNHLGILGVTAHFTNEDSKLQTLALAMKKVQGAHTGKNQASIITDMVSDYNITTCLGYFMMDNASSNDTLIGAVAQYLNDVGISYDAEQKRLRCNGHIINLSIKAFLFWRNQF